MVLSPWVAGGSVTVLFPRLCIYLFSYGLLFLELSVGSSFLAVPGSLFQAAINSLASGLWNQNSFVVALVILGVLAPPSSAVVFYLISADKSHRLTPLYWFC